MANHLDIKYVIRFDVQNLQAALAAFVREKMDEQNLSTYDVERRSGGSITHGSVWNILNRRVKDVKGATLRALAKGLGVSEEEIFAVARGKSPEPMTPTDFYSALEALGVEQFQAYGGVANLTDEDRREIISMLEAMIEQRLKRRQEARKPAGKTKK